jgi:hypothetical protein
MQAMQTAFDFDAQRRASPPPELATSPEAAAYALERALCERLGANVYLTLTDNGRSMLSARRRAGGLHVRLHRMFLGVDALTLSAVARYLQGDHGATALLRRYVSGHRDEIRPVRAQPRQREHAGRRDLRAIFDALNARYFDGLVRARIAWGRRGSAPGRRRRRRSIKLGSYSSKEALIRVHPVLDAEWVPELFVHYIVYHEMVHHVVDMPARNGRRTLHGPDFRARERQFAHYAEAIAWEQRNLDRLLSG